MEKQSAICEEQIGEADDEGHVVVVAHHAIVETEHKPFEKLGDQQDPPGDFDSLPFLCARV